MAKIIKYDFEAKNNGDIKKNTRDNGDKELKLSLTPQEEGTASDFQKEMLEDEMRSFVPVKEGNINVSGVYAYDMGKYVEVKVFIRNATNRTIRLDDIPFMILGEDGNVIAYQIFNLKAMGKLPPHSARPWKLNFDKKNITVEKIPHDGWKIGFDNRLKFVNYVPIEYEGLPEDLNDSDRVELENFLLRLPELEKGKFSISRFSMGAKKDGTLWITLVMRNADDKAIDMKNLPVTISDDKGNKVFSGNFDISGFSVSPKKARVLNLSYNTGTPIEQDIDLSNWSIDFK